MANPQYAGIFKHKFRGDYQNKPSVYKIWSGDHYFIWKCQALHNSMYHIGGDIERSVRKGPRPGNSFEKLVHHIISNNTEELEVELLIQSDDALNLLKKEYELLQGGKEHPKCLNIKFTPHVAKWVPEEVVNEYNNWLLNK